MKLAKRQENQSTIRFSAKLVRPQATEKSGSWALLTLPKNASAKLPSRGLTMVEGTINGFPFRAALEPNGQGSHRLKVNQALHDAAGRRRGRHGNGGDYADRRRTGDQGATGSTPSPGRGPAGAGLVGGYHTHGAPGLDSLDKLRQATGNAPDPDRESLLHAGGWKATGLLFWRFKLAEERSRQRRRNLASVAEPKKSSFAGIDKVENRENWEKLRANIWAARNCRRRSRLTIRLLQAPPSALAPMHAEGEPTGHPHGGAQGRPGREDDER